MRRIRTSAGQAAALWAATALVFLLLFPYWGNLLNALPACGFKRLTGLPCLTCGSSHSLQALARGDFASAFLWNPLAFVALAVFPVGGLLSGLWLMGVGPQAKAPSPRALRLLIVGGVVLLAVNWVYLWFSRMGHA